MYTQPPSATATDLSKWTRVTTSDVPPELGHLLTNAQWRWLLRMRDDRGLTPAFRKLGHRTLLCNTETLGRLLLAEPSAPQTA
jgi:hypothetical protein